MRSLCLYLPSGVNSPCGLIRLGDMQLAASLSNVLRLNFEGHPRTIVGCTEDLAATGLWPRYVEYAREEPFPLAPHSKLHHCRFWFEVTPLLEVAMLLTDPKIQWLDADEFAAKLKTPVTGIRNHIRARTPKDERIPCIRLAV
jgi:hypothetical protein